MDDEILVEINERLRQLVALTAATQIADMKQTDAVHHLMKRGFDTKAICDATGYPNSSIAPIVSRAKAGGKSKAKK